MILTGDCLVEMKNLDDNSVHSIVTDPPYGLSFMGKKWDYDVPSVEIWKETLRVIKPGGHLLSFAGSRTYHRMAVNIEDAGFEIRDQIMWVYGSGFPKSHNIGKAVDKLQGNERVYIGQNQDILTKQAKDLREGKRKIVDSFNLGNSKRNNGFKTVSADITKGNSPWEGWGTALKPAHEPIVVARKPISEKNIAENVLKWGTAGINIDGCRVKLDGTENLDAVQKGRIYGDGEKYGKAKQHHTTQTYKPEGRFPSNFIHDGSDEVVGLFPETKSGNLLPHHKTGTSGLGIVQPRGKYNSKWGGDSGSAARFFYVAKSSKSERNKGLEGFEDKRGGTERMNNSDGRKAELGESDRTTLVKNNHPTVKPIKLMQYLVKLVTPPNGIVLDPFMGSGTTGIACVKEGFDFIGIEMEEEYVEIAKARMKSVQPKLL